MSSKINFLQKATSNTEKTKKNPKNSAAKDLNFTEYKCGYRSPIVEEGDFSENSKDKEEGKSGRFEGDDGGNLGDFKEKCDCFKQDINKIIDQLSMICLEKIDNFKSNSLLKLDKLKDESLKYSNSIAEEEENKRILEKEANEIFNNFTVFMDSINHLQKH